MAEPIRMTQVPQSASTPDVPLVTQMAAPDTSVVNEKVGGSIDSVRKEIDDCYAQIEMCHQNEPDWCMRIISGHSARLSFLRGCITRIEDRVPGWHGLRTRELEPAL